MLYFSDFEFFTNELDIFLTVKNKYLRIENACPAGCSLEFSKQSLE